MFALNNKKRLVDAVTRGNADTVGTLLACGSDANTVDPYTKEPVLHIAIIKGHETIMQALLDAGADANSLSYDQSTSLHKACQVGSMSAVGVLLNKVADLNSRNNAQQTPLRIAILNGHHEIVRHLLSRGSPIDEVDTDQLGLLQLASKEGNLESVRALLDYGAGKSNVPSGADTPLHFATHRGRTDIMNLLIERGANVNARGDNNAAPLHLACDIGDIEAAKLLLDSGADKEIITTEGKTALMLAKEKGHTDIVAFVAPPDKVFAAAETGRCEDLTCLLKEDVNPDVRNEKGDTLLHVACQKGHIDIVRVLVMYNANVNTRNRLENVPLHHAACAGNIDIVCLLADNDAEINAKGSNGWTPLHCASDAGHSELVEELLDRGADCRMTTDDGKSAHDVAVSQSYDKVAVILNQARSIPSRFLHILFSKQEHMETDTFLEKLSKNVRTVQEMKVFYTLIHANVLQKQANMVSGRRWLGRALANTARVCWGEQTLACYKTILKQCLDNGLLDEYNYFLYDNRAEIRRIENSDFILDMKATIQQNAARIQGLEGKIQSLEKNLELLDKNIKSVNKAHEDLKKGLRAKMNIEATVGMITGVLNFVSGGIAGGICPILGKLVERIVDFGDVAHISSIILSEAVNLPEATSFLKAFHDGVKMAQDALGEDIEGRIQNIGERIIDKKLEEALKKGEPLVVLGIGATFVNPNSNQTNNHDRTRYCSVCSRSKNLVWRNQ